jgi:hypothetical protein
MIVTKQMMDKVDLFLKELAATGAVEKECGQPIKVQVNWARGRVLIRGPKSGRELLIEDILKCEEDSNE